MFKILLVWMESEFYVTYEYSLETQKNLLNERNLGKFDKALQSGSTIFQRLKWQLK